MTEHTPGPWIYESETKTIRSKPANYWLASMDSWDGAVNNEANARLIAAAPETAAERDRLKDINADLLAALEAAVARVELAVREEQRPIMVAWLPSARAAIAKAKAKGQ